MKHSLSQFLILIFLGLAVIICLSLGFWQLTRAGEKQQILSLYNKFAKKPPTSLLDLTKPKQYQHVILTGEYLPITILLDNQHYHHQFGYNILTPYHLKTTNKIVLVDRGWVEGDASRKQLPLVKTPVGLLPLTGSIYYPYGHNFILGPQIEKRDYNIAIVEQLDLKIISKFMHKTVEPYIIRLAAHENYGFIRQWPVVSILPLRHYAYATQWFAMAAIALLSLIFLIRPSKLNWS